MADHIITLGATAETLYQQWLVLNAKTEVTAMTELKDLWFDKIGKEIDAAGATKFAGLTYVGKIAFLQQP